MGSTTRFDWQEAVQQDETLKRLDTFVQRAIERLPGQEAPVRAEAGGGSRYAPAPTPPTVKIEPQRETMRTERPVPTTVNSNGTVGDSSSGGSTPQFINFRDYQSESSSDFDMREVNPMDELSDFAVSDTENSQQMQRREQEQKKQQEQEEQEEDEEMDDGNDVDMVEESTQESAQESGLEEEEDREQTVCEVCKVSENEGQIILCDECDAEYHIYCLTPALPRVPEGSWFCPSCATKHADAQVRIKEERVRTATASGDAGANAAPSQATVLTANDATVARPSGSAPTNGSGGDAPTSAMSVSVAQALEEDPEKTNSLLIHACNCDDVKCTDLEFQVFCPHMKRFLRSVCWASHSDKWRSYPLARITAGLFAYHAMHCDVQQCNVPLCVKIREEEIV